MSPNINQKLWNLNKKIKSNEDEIKKLKNDKEKIE